LGPKAQDGYVLPSVLGPMSWICLAYAYYIKFARLIGNVAGSDIRHGVDAKIGWPSLSVAVIITIMVTGARPASGVWQTSFAISLSPISYLL
jgi:hypothetical protein